VSIHLYTKVDGVLIPSKATPFAFPGGERSIKYVEGDLSGEEYALVRGADANDYVSLQMWAEIAKFSGGKAHAVIPYLPGARDDRGDFFGAFHYVNLITAGAFDSLIFFDGHSRVMPSMLTRGAGDRQRVEVHAASVIHRVLGDWRPDFIIAPDKGAVARAGSVARVLDLPLIKFEKKRDFETGKLSGFHAIDAVPETGHGLIVDDICDAGGTFLGVAIASGLPRARLSLYVSHGIFSGGPSRNTELEQAFDKIYTTDSHHEFDWMDSFHQTFAGNEKRPGNLIVSDILNVLEAYL
jgi:ribose-phosphate pyrophosphokinase